MGSQIYVRGPCAPPVRPLAEIFFIPEASTLLCLTAFLISTFNFFAFRDIRGSQIYTRGSTPPGRPLAEIFLYPRRVRYYV